MTSLTREEFNNLFVAALELALVLAEQRFSQRFSQDIEVELHGAGHPSHLMSSSSALDALYLGPDLFYRVIDIAVIGASPQYTRIFVRASAHQPGTFEQTWNDPPGTGPFHVIVAERIKPLPN